MEIIPAKTAAIMDFMLPFRFTVEEIEKLLSPSPAPWYEFGKRLERQGMLDKAEHCYRQAIDNAGKDRAQPSYFVSLYGLYRRQKEETKALETLRTGIEYLPDYSPLRVMMGDYYRNQGILYRAAQEYDQALRLDPGNAIVRRKLLEVSGN